MLPEPEYTTHPLAGIKAQMVIDAVPASIAAWQLP